MSCIQTEHHACQTFHVEAEFVAMRFSGARVCTSSHSAVNCYGKFLIGRLFASICVSAIVGIVHTELLFADMCGMVACLFSYHSIAVMCYVMYGAVCRHRDKNRIGHEVDIVIPEVTCLDVVDGSDIMIGSISILRFHSVGFSSE
jgi:hypothetical protein